MENKACSKCKKEKELNSFYVNNSLKSGRSSACRKCINGWRDKRTNKIFIILINLALYVNRFGFKIMASTTEGIRAVDAYAKRCSFCEKIKNINLFSRNKTRSDLRSHVCKECTRELVNKCYRAKQQEYLKKRELWGKKNPQKVKSYQKKYYNKNPELDQAKGYFRKGLTGVSIQEIPTDLIEYKRLQILLKRAYKFHNQHNDNKE